MLRSQNRMVLSSKALIAIGLFCFYLVVARNADLSGKIGLSLAMYGGCLCIALLGSHFRYRLRFKADRFIWLLCLIPFFYSSPIWLDAALFAIGILLVIFLKYRTADLNILYKGIIFVALFNSVCVFIQYFDKSFFDGFAKAWYSEGMYKQYQMTLKYENYLNGCNAISGDTTGYIMNCAGLLYAVHLIQKHKKRNISKIAMFLVCLIAIILTGKRAILVCGVASAMILYIISGRSSKKVQRLFVVLLLLVLLLRSITFIAEIFPGANTIVRIADSIEGLIYGKDITSGRTRLYGYALLQFKSAPVFGIGWKEFNSLTTTLYNYSSVHYVNNDYLQVLCETGIVGFICIYLPMFIFLIKSMRSYSSIIGSRVNNNIKIAAGFSLFIQMFYLTYSFFEIPLYDRCFFFTYILAVSIGYCAQSEFKTTKQRIGQTRLQNKMETP